MYLRGGQGLMELRGAIMIHSSWRYLYAQVLDETNKVLAEKRLKRGTESRDAFEARGFALARELGQDCFPDRQQDLFGDPT